MSAAIKRLLVRHNAQQRKLLQSTERQSPWLQTVCTKNGKRQDILGHCPRCATSIQAGKQMVDTEANEYVEQYHPSIGCAKHRNARPGPEHES